MHVARRTSDIVRASLCIVRASLCIVHRSGVKEIPDFWEKPRGPIALTINDPSPAATNYKNVFTIYLPEAATLKLLIYNVKMYLPTFTINPGE